MTFNANFNIRHSVQMTWTRQKGGRFFEILWPFHNIWTLKKHIERRHGIVPDTHPEAVCRYCQEEFIDKESNTRHPCPVRMKANETLKAKVTIFQTLLVQLNEYQSDPYFLQLSQNMATNCLFTFVFLPEFTCFAPKIVLFWCSEQCLAQNR